MAPEAIEVSITAPDEPTAAVGHYAGSPRQGVFPGFNYRIGSSNVTRIGFATAETVPENSRDSVQTVAPPCEVVGRFDSPDDDDTYQFTARKGTYYCIDVVADRITSKVDPYVVVSRIDRSDDGSPTLTQVAENDDLASFFAADGKSSI